MIFYRKGVRNVTKKGTEIMYDIDKKIDFSVFPGMQVSTSLCSGTACPSEAVVHGTAVVLFLQNTLAALVAMHCYASHCEIASLCLVSRRHNAEATPCSMCRPPAPLTPPTLMEFVLGGFYKFTQFVHFVKTPPLLVLCRSGDSDQPLPPPPPPPGILPSLRPASLAGFAIV